MKRKSVLFVLLCLTLVLSMAFTACKKAPQTLEEYAANDESIMSEIEEVSNQAGLAVKITGNDIVFTCDIKDISSDVSADIAKSETMINALSSGLEGASSTFTSICSEIEEQSKIKGIKVIVTYTYDGEDLITKTFNKDGIVE